MENYNEKLADIQEDPERLEYIIEDIDNPNSVVNLISKIPTLADAVNRVLVESPDLMAMDAGTLQDHTKPTVTLMRIRMSFWAEYENAVTRQRKMKLSQIIGGICTEVFFKTKILSENKKLAFILCPPTDYVVQVKEALSAGLETLRQIVSAKVVDEDGNLIPRAADVVLKTVALLDMRVKGAIVQRLDQRTISYNKNENINTTETTTQFVIPNSIEELDRELAEVREKLALAAPSPAVQITRSFINSSTDEEREAVPVEIELRGNAPGSWSVKK